MTPKGSELVRMILATYSARRREYTTLAFVAVVIVMSVALGLHQRGIAMTHTEQVLDCHYAGKGAHTHDKSCYDTAGNLVCPLTEREYHVHDDSCYTESRELACGLDEHVHTDACYDEEGNLSCGMDEHQHSDACYQVTRELTCKKEEVTETHTHGPGCFREVVVDDGEPAANQEQGTEKEVASNDESTNAEMPAQTFSQELKDEEGKAVLRVDVDAPEGALPEGTTMQASWVDPSKLTKKERSAVKKAIAKKTDGKVLDQQAVDITFIDAEGNKVEPSSKVTVTFTSEILGTDDQATVVHIDDLTDKQLEEQQKALDEGKTAEEAEPKRTAQVVDELSDDELSQHDLTLGDDQLAVESDRFSTYVLAVTSVAHTLEASDGGTYTVTMDAPAAAGVPAGAELRVSEVYAESDTHDTYEQGAAEALGVEGGAVALSRFFDIKIVGADGQEIQPAAPVQVRIELADVPEDAEAGVVHFDSETGEPEVVEAQPEGEGTTAFDAEGFSVYGVVYTVGFHWEIDGKIYDFSLPGGGFISFQSLAEELKLASSDTGVDDKGTESFIAEIETITFSNPDLVWVRKVDAETTVGTLKQENELDVQYSADHNEAQIDEINTQTVHAGDWALISLKPFDTRETLTVTMKTGEVFEIRVTDDQIVTQYLSAKGNLYDVTVVYGEDAKIPEGASLQVTEYDEGSDDYHAVRKAVLGDEEAATADVAEESLTVQEGETATIGEAAAEDEDPSSTAGTTAEEVAPEANDSTDAEEVAEAEEPVSTEVEDSSSAEIESGEVADEAAAESTNLELVLEALDISILDQDGNPIEPAAPVEVRIAMNSLPDDVKNFEKTASVQHLNASSGKVEVETVADTEDVGGIYVADKTALADFTLDSFSQFAITYYQNNPRVTVNVHYVDTNGNELNGTTTDVTASMNQSISLSSYQNHMTQWGYTYLGAHYGTYSGQLITSLRGTTNSAGSLSSSNYIVEFLNGDNIVARQEYEGSLRLIDVYLVYAPDRDYYIQDTIGADGCLTVYDGNTNDVLQTGNDQNVYVKWYRGSDGIAFEEVTRSKVLDGNYNIPELGGPKVNVSIDEGAHLYYKAEIYKVENNQEVSLGETQVYHVPYYDDVRNGGFETPYNDGNKDESVNKWPSNWQVENGQNGVIWKTTGVGVGDKEKQDIEIPNGASASTGASNMPNYIAATLRNYCFAFMPEGKQCAELNCEASGSLYQDVLTIPGSQIYWSLYHRARGAYDYWKNRQNKYENEETDTMYVVAMSTELAEKYDVTTQEKVLAVLNHVNDPNSEFHDVEIVKITTTNQGNGTMEFLNTGATVTVPPTYFGNLTQYQTVTDPENGNKQYTYGNTDWHYYTGNFSIPQNQYLTRFFFVAGKTASNNPTMGNFIDDIKLSDSVPSPNHGQATVIIKKTVTGLNELPSNYATRIETSYEVKKYDTTTETKDRNSDYDSYMTLIDTDGHAVSTATWTFPIPIDEGNGEIIKFTNGTETDPQGEGKTDVVEGYEQTTTYVIREQRSSQTSPEDVASGSGKVIPKSKLNELTVNERDIIYIEFTNSYVKKQHVSVWKTDMDSKVITTGASFDLYKAGDFNDSTNRPNNGAQKVSSGTTGANGILDLGELPQGEYRLLETKAPDGYNAAESAIKITVSADGVIAMQGTARLAVDVKGNEHWVQGQPDNTYQIQVENNPGVALPNAGGSGINWIYSLGIMLMGVAGMGLVTRAKNRTE